MDKYKKICNLYLISVARYHTAGTIEDLRKAEGKDTSIHKRLSWNQANSSIPGNELGQVKAESKSFLLTTKFLFKGSREYGEGGREVPEQRLCPIFERGLQQRQPPSLHWLRV